MNYLSSKLNKIRQQRNNEKLYIVTDDREIRQILIEFNEFLNHYFDITASYVESEESMKRMISNISHDLKTPLTVIMGYVETLIIHNKDIDESSLRNLEKTYRKTQELNQLINNFFDLAKLESGDMEIPLERLEISELCRETILSFYKTLQDKNIEVDIHIPSERVYVMSNKEAVIRILNNLITNAIEYGADGKKIGIKLSCSSEDVVIEVWDCGKGIDTDNLSNIFERLYTLEDSRNKAYQGSGLGLSITKRLVEKLDGEIVLLSKPFEKTSFKVKLKRLTY